MLIFSDTFTEASTDRDLEDHVPDFGISWTELWATTPGVGWDVDQKNDWAKGVALGVLSSGAVYTADAAGYSADYGVTATLLTLGSSVSDDRPIYLFVRIQDVDNLYAARLARVTAPPGPTVCRLYKKVLGVWMALGAAFDPPADGSVIKLEIVGSILNFYDDGLLVASATDGDIAAAGKAGIGIGGGAELVQPTDLNVFHTLDNLSVNSVILISPSPVQVVLATPTPNVVRQGPFVFLDCLTLWRIWTILRSLPPASGYRRPAAEPTDFVAPWEVAF